MQLTEICLRNKKNHDLQVGCSRKHVSSIPKLRKLESLFDVDNRVETWCLIINLP